MYKFKVCILGSAEYDQDVHTKFHHRISQPIVYIVYILWLLTDFQLIRSVVPTWAAFQSSAFSVIYCDHWPRNGL